MKEEWKRGQKSPLCLTPTTYEQMRRNCLIIQYENDKKSGEKNYRKLNEIYQKTKQRAEIEFRRRMIYYIIFRVMSIETPNKHYNNPGVSVSDIIRARHDGHAFFYLKLEEDRSTVEECIRYLQKDNIVKEIKIPSEEPRYIFIDSIWKDFVIECSKLLEHTITLRQHIIWQSIRKPTPMERLFQEVRNGKQSADAHLNRVCQILERNKKNRDKRSLEIPKHTIETLDYNILQDVRELRKKYQPLIESHAWTCKIIINTLYPEFIQREVERIEKNKKTKNEKYPKLIRTFASSVTTM